MNRTCVEHDEYFTGCISCQHDMAEEIEILREQLMIQKGGNVSPTEGTARSAQPQLSDVRELVEMVEAIPCICEECYTSRKLTQPDCPKCNYISVDVINKVKAHF